PRESENGGQEMGFDPIQYGTATRQQRGVMSFDGEVTVAAVQAAPVFLDRDATIDVLIGHVEEAAAEGAQLVAFPEAIVPGYPVWIWQRSGWSDGDLYD